MDGLRILTDKHVGGAIIHALALLYTLFAAYWVCGLLDSSQTGLE
jgi:hypothetical protein